MVIIPPISNTAFLKEFGLKLDTKTLHDITYRYARMALNNAALKFTESVAGCRVVVSTDGIPLQT